MGALTPHVGFMISAPASEIGKIIILVLEIIKFFAGKEEFSVTDNLAEAVDQCFIPGKNTFSVTVSVTGIKTAHAGSVGTTLVKKNTVRSQIHTFL